MPPVMKPAELERYAELIVSAGVSTRRGDTLVVQGAHAHRDLMLAVAEAAYRRGAVAVEAKYDDARLMAARIKAGRDDAIGHVTPWGAALTKGLGHEQTAAVYVMGDFE